MFQPVIPQSGIGGWRFLEATYDRQLESHSKSAQIRQDREYLVEKFAKPMTVDEFLDDTRLVRVTMTAFDLGGEEWKKGFIRKVLTEVADPDSTFLPRLNNPKYTEFANAMLPLLGEIRLSEEKTVELADKFELASFEAAVGEVDDTMRLALNYKSEIGSIVGSGAEEKTVMYRILGDIPIRTMLERAVNLPTDIRKLDVDKQAEIFTEKLKSAFGITRLSDMADPKIIDKAILRYHAMESIQQSVASTSSASAALTLLSNAAGFGSQASQNLFLSNF
ncbi:MAG: DUF1217 domain-containing protein [Hyphomonas sp.]|nr:DUF1217 domain-containing protein [Hyphomonas sp.]